MKTLLHLTALLFIGFASSMKTPKELSETQIAYLTELSQTLNEDANRLIDEPSPLPIGKNCIRHSDCEIPTWRCENIEGALIDAFNHTSHESDIERVKRKAKISGKECIRPISEVLNAYPKDDIVSRIAELLNEMNGILEKGNLQKYGVNASELVTATIDVTQLSAPLTRVADITNADPLSTLFLFLAVRGNSQTSIDATALILFSLLSTQSPGTNLGSNPFNNPFLLYILLNDDSGSGSDLFLYFLILNGNIGFNYAPSSSRQGRQGTAAIDPYENAFLTPFLLFTLLNSDTDDNLLLYIALFGGLNGIGESSGVESLLPLLLLSGGQLGGSNNNLFLLLLLSGGSFCGTGSTHGGYESILPLILLGGGNSGNNNLLFFLLLSGNLCGGDSGYGNAGLNSLLPLLILSNNSFAGGDSDLLLLLLSGGLGGYGDDANNLNSLLPILLLSDNGLGNGNNDFLILLALSGGFGEKSNANSLLPLLLLRDSGSDDTLLLLFLFGFFQNASTFFPGGAPTIYG